GLPRRVQDQGRQVGGRRSDNGLPLERPGDPARQEQARPRPVVLARRLDVSGHRFALVTSGKFFNTESTGFTATCPRPQIEVSVIVSPSSGSTSKAVRGAEPVSTASSSSTAFCEPTRPGPHFPHDSFRKTFTTF